MWLVLQFLFKIFFESYHSGKVNVHLSPEYKIKRYLYIPSKFPADYQVLMAQQGCTALNGIQLRLCLSPGHDVAYSHIKMPIA